MYYVVLILIYYCQTLGFFNNHAFLFDRCVAVDCRQLDLHHKNVTVIFTDEFQTVVSSIGVWQNYFAYLNDVKVVNRKLIWLVVRYEMHMVIF